MPELGNKFECFSCGAKFYDLGKLEPICPKCGANQRDAKKHEAQHETSHAKRRKREEPVRAPVEEEEILTPAPDEEFAEEEIERPEGVSDDDEPVEEVEEDE